MDNSIVENEMQFTASGIIKEQPTTDDFETKTTPDDVSQNPAKGCFAKEWKHEILSLINIAGPSTFINLVSGTYRSFTIIFVGQYLTTDDFAGMALGTLTTNLTGLASITGALSAMDTLCGHVNKKKSVKENE
ncbi:hypothetical protein RFI_09292 [Reticulomyxa filosa]|uniref:Uncharacterized protein n=1 Tax=Reticulomyxa filosa TaxID=46433 RepID=X6NQ51_RETFI|nr:hypothetical protein RFI_09292 [Reticulomyxa filosa]|eukprot:ETO27839.1 hypothetical protein RFI_09292 [Reticulomyxa filosa]